jgi:hypothetical protein
MNVTDQNMETPEGAVRAISSYFVEGYWRSDS